MPLFGYARVSTRDQDLAAQDAELRAAGCAKVFKEKISGAKACRYAAGSVGQINPRSAQRDCGGCRAWRWLQEPQGCLGGYHERPRSADAHRARWPG
jgi:Resolvase, N terminal domain